MLKVFYSTQQAVNPQTGQLNVIKNYAIEANRQLACKFLNTNRVNECSDEDLNEVIILNGKSMSLKELLDQTAKLRG